ncbi:hypothetical protein Cni_G02786 [Canna indica]|uniref:Uncharacterized protein n=1 Tax=Canna indica TaxID=4628 RepID=A0AAQ3JPW1_9LILI|nr:hypothetical protein Cni_G02786 [Canna indica]
MKTMMVKEEGCEEDEDEVKGKRSGAGRIFYSDKMASILGIFIFANCHHGIGCRAPPLKRNVKAGDTKAEKVIDGKVKGNGEQDFSYENLTIEENLYHNQDK